MWRCDFIHLAGTKEHFTDMVAILNSVLKNVYIIGCPVGKCIHFVGDKLVQILQTRLIFIVSFSVCKNVVPNKALFCPL